jgi:HSP20 family protein
MIRFQQKPISTRFFERHPAISMPVADIKEDSGNFYLGLELPGTRKDDLRIWMEEDILTIDGEKKETVAQGQAKHFSERWFGKFHRSFRLPKSIDSEKIRAEFNDGVLIVTLPKSAEAKPKDIEIG